MQDIHDLARTIKQGLDDGTLQLCDVVGLTDAEVNAVVEVAEAESKRGRYSNALSVYATLVLHEPLRASHWIAIGSIQQQAQQHMLAVLSFETAAMLEGRTIDLERRTRRSLRRTRLSRDVASAYDAAVASDRALRRQRS